MIRRAHPAIVADDEVLTRRQRDFWNVPSPSIFHIRFAQRCAIDVHLSALDCDVFTRQCDDPLHIKDMRTRELDRDDLATSGLPALIGETIDKVEGAGLIGRRHADPFGANRDQHPFEGDETQYGENEHPYERAPGIAAEDKTTSQAAATQWSMINDQCAMKSRMNTEHCSFNIFFAGIRRVRVASLGDRNVNRRRTGACGGEDRKAVPFADAPKRSGVERSRRRAAVPALVVEFDIDVIGWSATNSLRRTRG